MLKPPRRYRPDSFQEIDKDGKKFDRVSRMTSNPTQRDLTMTLDYANEFIQFKPQEYFTMTLATSLHEDGDDEEITGGPAGATGGPEEASKKVAKREMWRGGEEGLAEQYEYVMHGKVSISTARPRRIDRLRRCIGQLMGYDRSRVVMQIYKFDETRSGENST